MDPGFTPSVRDLEGLLALLGDDDLAPAAERAIARLGPAALGPLETTLASAVAPQRARVVRTIGRLAAAGSPDAARSLEAVLARDPDPKSRRTAATALGHVSGGSVEAALLGAWSTDPRPEMQRTLAAALGKVGGRRALDVLREARAQNDDPELARIAGRAAMMIERTLSRAASGAAGSIDLARRASAPAPVTVVCRAGLEGVLLDELTGVPGVEALRVEGRGRVGAVLSGAPEALYAARTMLWFEVPLPVEHVGADGDVGRAVARAVSSEAARRVLATWSGGGVRYRVAWEGGGHRRAQTWRTAQAIAEAAPEMINDPTASPWEIRVAEKGDVVSVALVPRGAPDRRFAWRRADVPAASHPTLAAGLARIAGARPDDVAWDPFVGSGAELIERARLGPYRSLLGTDVDERALRAARENLAADGVVAGLEIADAFTASPAGLTLILTNPPMGRRASRVAGLADKLDGFVGRVSRLLVPGGRFVWIAPWPARARAAGRDASLVLEEAAQVDMGGFDGEIQKWLRR